MISVGLGVAVLDQRHQLGQGDAIAGQHALDEGFRARFQRQLPDRDTATSLSLRSGGRLVLTAAPMHC